MPADNTNNIGRRLLLTPLVLFGFASIIATGGSGNSGGGDDGGELPLEASAAITLSSELVAVTRGDSRRVRVDVEGLPQGQGVAGFSIDLSEVLSRIDIQTEACPAGAGTPSCRDWTISPAADSIPGDYVMEIAAAGTTSRVAAADLRIRVIGDLPPRGPALVASERLVITTDGRLWARGPNFVGQAGIGFWNACTDFDHHCLQPSETHDFTQVGTQTDWVHVAASSATSVAVRATDGSVWAWGHNAGGTLGFESAEGRQLEPARVPGFGAAVTQVSIGRSNNASGPVTYLARTSLGNVYAWGGTRSSGLVNGTTLSSVEPRLVPQAVSEDGVEAPLDAVSAIAGGTSIAGKGFALARKSDGSVWQWGGGEFYGVNDDGDFEARAGMPRVVAGLAQVRSIAVGTRPVSRSPGLGFAVVATMAGEVFAWDEEASAPQQVTGLSNIVGVSADDDGDAAAFDGDGIVWRWSYGRSGPQAHGGTRAIVRLGHGTTRWAIAGDCDAASGSLWSLFTGQSGPTGRLEPRFGLDCEPPTAFNLRLEIAGEGTVATHPPYLDCNSAVCATSVPAGARLALSYLAAPGWQRTSTSCDDAVVMDADRTCPSTFELRPPPKTLAITLAGQGRVTSAPQGIDCPADCTQTYASGGPTPTVTLTATADRGYRFVALRGDPECADGSFTMAVSRQCDAVFEAFPIPVAPAGLTATPGNDFVQLTWTAVPDRVVRYALERAESGGPSILIAEIDGGAGAFRDDNVVPGREYSYRLVAINASGSSPPATVTALVPSATSVTLTVQVTGPGRVVSLPAGIDCPGDCTQSYSLVTNVTLTATANASSRFDGWGGSCSGTAPTATVTTDDNRTCTAQFSSTSAGGWVTLASEIASSLELPLHSSVALTPSGLGFIAYLQTVSGQNRLSVRRINTGFPPLGLALNATAGWSASSPGLVVDSTDTPIIIFCVDLSEIWVARWSGLQWDLLRPDPNAPLVARLNLTVASASRPRIVRSGNTLIAAWIENERIAVRRYDLLTQQWDAGAFIPTPTNPFDIDLAVDQNGLAVVAWSDQLLGARLQATRETAPGTWVAVGGEIGTRPQIAPMVLEFGVHVDTAGTIRVAWVEGDTNYFVQLAQFDGANWVALPGRGGETRFHQGSDRVRALSVNREPALFAFAYAVDIVNSADSFIVVQQLLGNSLASVGSEFQTRHPQVGDLNFAMLQPHAATMGQSQATPAPFRLAVRRHFAP